MSTWLILEALSDREPNPPQHCYECGHEWQLHYGKHGCMGNKYNPIRRCKCVRKKSRLIDYLVFGVLFFLSGFLIREIIINW